jgi:2,3-bisphosphoglycerate-dependent phosphoglycerate mutase
MPRLIAALIRHGDYKQLPETPSAHQPFPLTSKGKDQARQAGAALCETLKTRGWRLWPAVDSSQLLRGWQTAQIITNELSPHFDTDPSLNGFDNLAERGLGSAANLNLAMIEAIVREDPRFPELPPDWKSNSGFRLPLQGAESLLEAGERVAQHIERRMRELARQADCDTLKLFVGHGAAFRHAAFHMGVLSFEQIAQLSMYHAQPVFLEYRTKEGWHHIGGKWKVRSRHSAHLD